LKGFRIGLPIGLEEKVLERGVGALDLIAVLQDEGFNDFVTFGTTWRKMYGYDFQGLRDLVAGETLGIPRNAKVTIKPIGHPSKLYILTFDY